MRAAATSMASSTSSEGSSPTTSGWSKRRVYSATASSPRARTSATMALTTDATSSSISRLAWSGASKLAAKSGARASRRRAISALVVLGPPPRRPFVAYVAQARIDALDIELDRTAAREQKLHRTGRIVAAFGLEADRQQRHHRVGSALLDALGLGRQHVVE